MVQSLLELGPFLIRTRQEKAKQVHSLDKLTLKSVSE